MLRRFALPYGAFYELARGVAVRGVVIDIYVVKAVFIFCVFLGRRILFHILHQAASRRVGLTAEKNDRGFFAFAVGKGILYGKS